MKRLLIGGVLALATPAVAVEIPGIEPVYGVIAGNAGVTLRVASNGCTRKGDLTIAVSKGQPRPILLIARKHPDACTTPGRAEITYGWDELGLKPGQAFSFANPLIAEPSSAPAAAATPRGNGACQKLEVDAVVASGQGPVRVLGPRGEMLDIDTPPLVASGEITGAEAGVDGGQDVVRLAFTPAASQRLSTWTAAHVGARLAILLDGRVLRLGDVRGPIGGAGLAISGVDRKQALTIAAGVGACGG